TVKPSSIAAHREIQSVDPDALSDEDLIAYIKRCRDHHAAMITQHMRFTASAVVPTGDFLAHVGDWTGLPPAELLGLMRGAARVCAPRCPRNTASSSTSCSGRPGSSTVCATSAASTATSGRRG